MRIDKIVSGGQTGVDRAALDFALAAGIGCGGWCPKGRLAEDGMIDPRYPLTETDSPDYAVRTARNVRDADGTLVLYRGSPDAGTVVTIETARALNKPLCAIDLLEAPLQPVRRWLSRASIHVLNVAGPRESNQPGIYDESRRYLSRLLPAVPDGSPD